MISIRSWVRNIMEPPQHTVQALDLKKKKKKKKKTQGQRCRDIVHFETHASHNFVLPPTTVEKKAFAR